MYDPYLSELMRKYRFTIINMRGMQSGLSSWKQGATPQFDASGQWKEISIHIRRDIVCEMCGHNFDINFTTMIDSAVEKGISTVDTGRMTAVLERELRRRIKCPRCGIIQQQVRRKILRRNARHNFIGMSAIGANVLGAILFSMCGYALAGRWGLITGLVLSLVMAVKLTRWMLATLLEFDL
jgi:DNA-directed RNA polymerase subunit RPC12/RpoP